MRTFQILLLMPLLARFVEGQDRYHFYMDRAEQSKQLSAEFGVSVHLFVILSAQP